MKTSGEILFKLFILSNFLTVAIANAQTPSLEWARNIGGARGDNIKADAAGNVYTTGYFSGVADFDPGPATFYLTADGGGADDAYVSKLDAAGNFVWAKRIGGNATNYGMSVSADAAGNVYSVGYFNGTVDFDPGAGVFNITTTGQNDIYISKLDAAGNFIWVKTIGGTFAEVANSLVLDAAGNLLISGNFVGSVDFDPGPGVSTLNGGGNNDCFMLKIDAAGNFVWAQQVAGNYSQGDAISVDGAGNIYVCGNYNNTADLNPGAGVYNVTSAGGADAFVIKLNSAGGFVWGAGFGSIGTDLCESVKADAAGNVYITGNFAFTADFDPGAGTYNITVAGSTDAYILKLDAAGSFVWAKVFAGTGAEASNDVAVDAMGNVFTTGLFQNTVDFDPGPGVYNLTIPGGGSNDIFIAKLDAAGNFAWAIQYGGATLDAGLSLFLDATGKLYATGYFEGVCDFDPGPGIVTLSSPGGRTFIVKLGDSAILPLTLLSFSGITNKEGNLILWKTAQEIGTKSFEIEWSTDGQQFEKIAVLPAAGNANGISNYSFIHKTPVNGDNYYRLKMLDVDGKFTYSKLVKITNRNTANAITVFPNPVTDIVNLNVNSDKKDTVLFYLYSADGKLVFSRSFNVVQGKNQCKWDAHSLPAGRYFISTANHQFPITQIIKQ